MKYRWLLAFPLLFGSLNGFAADSLPPRLVRYYFTDKSQVRALFQMGADIPAHGKNWVDVVMPARSLMSAQENRLLVEAVRGMKFRTLQEDLEAQFRRFATTPNLGVYHTLAEVKQEIDGYAAAHPDLARVSTIGKTGEGRDIWAIRIASNPQDGQKPAFLFTGAHHAREWISIEVPMAIIKNLIEGYYAEPAIKALVDSREVWVVPVVNPDGVQFSQTQYKMWRKNRRDNGGGVFGVDPSRNYGYKWGGEGASPSPDSETYRGPSAFSEPEPQAIRDLSKAKKFVSAISFHSYSELVLWPWGYTNEPSRDAAAFVKFGKAMAEFNHYTPEQSIELYPTTGDFDDFMYGELGVLAYTIELGTQFVPDEPEVPGIVAANLKAAMWLLQNAAEPFPPVFHDPLSASTNVAGPYAVQAKLRDPAFPVDKLELIFKKAGAAQEERTTMTPASGVYSASIPGGALGEVSYRIELRSTDGRMTRLPATGSYSFKVVDSLVLIVADDAGAGYSKFYTAALDALGKAYSIWDTKTAGSPGGSALSSASAVIWFCGDASSNTLTAGDQATLAAYLGAGGRLLLFGQDIGYDIKESAFYKDNLKAKFVADSAGDTALSGAAGGFAAGVSVTLGGDGVPQRYPEAIEPLAGAATLMTYANGKIGAIATNSGPGRAAYFGFGLEGVGTADTRKSLLEKALTWAAAAVDANVARLTALEKAARAGDRSAAGTLAAARDEVRKVLEAGGAEQARHYKAAAGASPARALRPLLRDADRMMKYEGLK
ncbi:MAG: zinc carboxypeptidase [Candidatus Wallbacteria bacterium]|nr:zinc carboxypeptidase [Candidatus Wallbacteria bacterium]